MRTIMVAEGEYWDKITILLIKMSELEDEEDKRDIFKDILLLLNMANNDRIPNINCLLQLFKINKELWNIENQIRDYDQDDEILIDLIKKVHKKNLKRNNLKFEMSLDEDGFVEIKDYKHQVNDE